MLFYVYVWPKNNKLIISLLSLIALFLLIICVRLVFLSSTSSGAQKYPFLSKRIFVENQNDIIINFSPLRNALRTYHENSGHSFSLYFEYLPSGSSIGIDDRTSFEIASLVKTPLVMTVYKEIEKGNIKATDILTLDEEDIQIGKGFGDTWKNAKGTSLTIEEAIKRTLQQSDNATANMLLDVTTEESINELFDDLDIERDDDGKIRTVSTKSYSSILRSLYLSSYLTNESSNMILNTLSETDFKNKIEAGVPKNIKVAHKIGVWETTVNGKEVDVYSDCGIIYAPARPYILCIMAKENEMKAAEHMSKLSKMIYDYIMLIKR